MRIGRTFSILCAFERNKLLFLTIYFVVFSRHARFFIFERADHLEKPTKPMYVW